MTLENFIKSNRCRQMRDECGDLTATGKRGTIYEHSSGVFAATIVGAPNGHHWNTWRTAFIVAGCRITQNGDTEGTALFNPANAEQSKVALSAIRAFRRRELSPEQRAVLTERLRRHRSLPAGRDIDGQVESQGVPTSGDASGEQELRL